MGDIQLLCPMNRGSLGARSLDIELQKALNPPVKIRIERFGWTFCRGDKVIQIENDCDREVAYGDLGVVTRAPVEEGELTVAFDGRDGIYGLANSMSWRSLIRRPFTKAKARNTRRS